MFSPVVGPGDKVNGRGVSGFLYAMWRMAHNRAGGESQWIINAVSCFQKDLWRDVHCTLERANLLEDQR